MRSQGFDKRIQGPSAFFERARRDDTLRAQLHAQSSTWVCEHGFSGARHQGKIRRVVSDVGEVNSAEALAEAVEFSASGQVVNAVAGKNFMEESEMIGNASRELGVGAGGEIDLASPRIFLVKKLKQLSVVGEMRHVESDILSNKCLEGCFAAKDHAGQAEKEQGMGARHDEQRVDESI